MRYEVTCYAVRRPVRPVSEGEFATLEDAKAHADALIGLATVAGVKARIESLLESVADQQAMPDDSWRAEWAKLSALLVGEAKDFGDWSELHGQWFRENTQCGYAIDEVGQ